MECFLGLGHLCPASLQALGSALGTLSVWGLQCLSCPLCLFCWRSVEHIAWTRRWPGFPSQFAWENYLVNILGFYPGKACYADNVCNWCEGARGKNGEFKQLKGFEQLPRNCQSLSCVFSSDQSPGCVFTLTFSHPRSTVSNICQRHAPLLWLWGVWRAHACAYPCLCRHMCVNNMCWVYFGSPGGNFPILRSMTWNTLSAVISSCRGFPVSMP